MTGPDPYRRLPVGTLTPDMAAKLAEGYCPRCPQTHALQVHMGVRGYCQLHDWWMRLRDGQIEWITAEVASRRGFPVGWREGQTV